MASSSIDHLRALLDHLDGTCRSHQLDFFRAILAAGQDCLPELDVRLPGSRAPRALRQLALEASFYFPWPEWVPILARILRYEADFAIFETGTRALGRIGNMAALEALRELLAMRQGAEFKEVISGVLSETDPAEAFNHHLSRLLEGSANPSVANEAAQRLVQIVDGDCLEPLKAVAQHPDLLVFRHALVLIANVFTPEAAEALLDYLRENHAEVLADRALKEAVGTLRALPGPAVREAAQAALQALRGTPAAQGPLHAFYTQASIIDEAKAGQLQALFTQTLEAMHLRSRRLGFAVDATAEGLAGMVAKGLVEPGRVLELLVLAYREQTGREGLARALARLAPAEDAELHNLILAGPDGAQRAAAVEILGTRMEEALQGALLQACRDPLTDIADRALYHVGRLASAEQLARDLLHSPAPDDLRLGLRLVAEHGYLALVPDLLELMRTSTREELVLQAIEALGSVGEAGASQAAEPLLAMLHSGQSPRLQTALALALRDLRQPAIALALCAKAGELRQPSLHVVAVEALAEAHGLAELPLPPDQGSILLDQVTRSWNQRNPWALRLRLVLALHRLHLDQPELWRIISDLVIEALADKRPLGVWTTAELHQVQASGRDFAKRASGR
jgi:HEAT repeat protein